MTMGDPSKQDILTIFKRLRSVPTNKVTASGRVQAGWASVPNPRAAPAAAVAAAAGGGAGPACDTSHLRPRRLGLAWVPAARRPQPQQGEGEGAHIGVPGGAGTWGSWGREAIASGGPGGGGHTLMVPDTGGGAHTGAAFGGGGVDPVSS